MLSKVALKVFCRVCYRPLPPVPPPPFFPTGVIDITYHALVVKQSSLKVGTMTNLLS